MRVAQAEILIDAPVDVVWSVVTDLDRYPEWNPFVERIDVLGDAPVVGTDLRLHVRWASGRRVRTREQITRLEPPNVLEYRFRGPIAALGLVRGARLQTLVPDGEHATRYRSREEFTGSLSSFTPLKAVQDGFERHAAALKGRAEAV